MSSTWSSGQDKWWETKDSGGTKSYEGDTKWQGGKEEASGAKWWETGASSTAATAPAPAADPWSQAIAGTTAKEASAGANWWEKEAQAPPQTGANGANWWEKAEAPKQEADKWSSQAWDKSAAADATADGKWGASGWGASTASAQPSGNDFWEFQRWNKEAGTLSRKDEWEIERDEGYLFTERLGSNAGIDFEKYDHVPVDVSGSKAELIPTVQSFAEMYTMFKECIPDALIENVKRCQYEKPTPVQKFAIPVGLVGRDVMCCAQTGSGKTAAFLFPVIGRMMMNFDHPTGNLTAPFEGPCLPDTLIMTPTRELCIQIYEEALKFCHRTPYRVCRVYGGEKPKDQMQEIAKGCDVMIATPGRLQDFINRGIVSVKEVYVLVLDEADRMLDMGFEPQIREICEKHEMPTKDNRQTMMFSATFPEACQMMAQDFLYNYMWVGVGTVGGAVDTVEQTLEKVSPKDKYDKLFEVIDNFYSSRQDKERCLVFVNAKDTAKWLDEQLYAKKIDTGALHGNLTQTERETNLGRFRRGEIDVMIATDVASRGLDIEKVGMVINYDMPDAIDSYVHRIGRTGRIGNKGKAVTFISCDEWGTSVENADVLKELLRTMRDVGSEIPDWLENLVEKGSSSRGYGRWGDKDMRKDTADWSSGDAKTGWSSWNNKGSEANAQDSWS